MLNSHTRKFDEEYVDEPGSGFVNQRPHTSHEEALVRPQRSKNATSLKGKKSELNSGQQHSKYPTNTSNQNVQISNSHKSDRRIDAFVKLNDGTVSVGILPNV